MILISLLVNKFKASLKIKAKVIPKTKVKGTSIIGMKLQISGYEQVQDSFCAFSFGKIYFCNLILISGC